LNIHGKHTYCDFKLDLYYKKIKTALDYQKMVNGQPIGLSKENSISLKKYLSR
jgi:hypothetical protein